MTHPIANRIRALPLVSARAASTTRAANRTLSTVILKGIAGLEAKMIRAKAATNVHAQVATAAPTMPVTMARPETGATQRATATKQTIPVGAAQIDAVTVWRVTVVAATGSVLTACTAPAASANVATDLRVIFAMRRTIVTRSTTSVRAPPCVAWIESKGIHVEVPWSAQ